MTTWPSRILVPEGHIRFVLAKGSPQLYIDCSSSCFFFYYYFLFFFLLLLFLRFERTIPDFKLIPKMNVVG